MSLSLQSPSLEHKCSGCGTSLTDANWPQFLRNVWKNECLSCRNKYQRAYWAKNRERQMVKEVRLQILFKNCRHCGVALTDENWFTSDRHNFGYICIACHRKRNVEEKRRRMLSPEYRTKYNARLREYRHKPEVAARQHVLRLLRFPREREQRHKKRRATYIHNRTLVLEYYGGTPPRCGCLKCPEANRKLLTIEHINGGGMKHRKEIASYTLVDWLVKNHFPRGFEILCWNCNEGRRLNHGVCPHLEEEKNE